MQISLARISTNFIISFFYYIIVDTIPSVWTIFNSRPRFISNTFDVLALNVRCYIEKYNSTEIFLVIFADNSKNSTFLCLVTGRFRIKLPAINQSEFFSHFPNPMIWVRL